jgi:hypothetical protein
MRSLYELTADALAVRDAIEAADGEITPEVEAALAELEAQAEGKLEAFGKLIANWQGEASALKAEEARLASRRKALDNAVTRLKDRARDWLEATGQTKVKAGVWTFAIQASPPSVAVTDQASVPAQYWVTPDPSLDRRAILDALKSGEVVPGAEIKTGTHLRIR